VGGAHNAIRLSSASLADRTLFLAGLIPKDELVELFIGTIRHAAGLVELPTLFSKLIRGV
jgi:hypothetical protein